MAIALADRPLEGDVVPESIERVCLDAEVDDALEFFRFLDGYVQIQTDLTDFMHLDPHIQMGETESVADLIAQYDFLH